MTIGNLIKNKDYDCINYRITIPSGRDIFAGRFTSKNGEIISLDGDIYNKEEKVLRYEEWSKPEDDIDNGLTIIVEGKWIGD